MEEEYWAECPSCDTESQVLVIDNEEVPQFCPMCGMPLKFEQLEEE